MTMHSARMAVSLLLLAGVSATAPSEREKEAELGKQLAEEFRRHTTKIDNPVVQTFLDRLGQRLAAQMPEARFPFTFSTVADDPCSITHEPSTLPGGYVFVPSSLFLAAENEGEFAAMLAHAMEHIVRRHGMREFAQGTVAPDSRLLNTNSSSMPIVFMGGFRGICSGAVPLAFRSSQRSNELKADSLAIQTLAHAGFDPGALVRYIERVQLPSAKMDGYAVLPPRDQRAAAILAAIGQLGPVVHAAGSPDDFAGVQHEVRVLSESPVRREEPPSLKRKTSN